MKLDLILARNLQILDKFFCISICVIYIIEYRKMFYIHCKLFKQVFNHVVLIAIALLPLFEIYISISIHKYINTIKQILFSINFTINLHSF